MQLNPRSGSVTFSSAEMKNFQCILEEMRDSASSAGANQEALLVKEIAGHIGIYLKPAEKQQGT